MNVLYLAFDNPIGCSSVSNHVFTFFNLQSVSLAMSDQGMIEYGIT